jgi:anti-anti-sigma factor
MMSETLHASSVFFTAVLDDEIDLANAEAIGDVLCDDAIHRADGGMVVDLSQLTFIDCRGVAMMIRVHDQADSLGKTVTWQGMQPNPMRVFQIVGVDKLLRLAE